MPAASATSRVRSEATTARVPAGSSSVTRHTARPDPSPIVIPDETSSTAAAAAASRAGEESATAGSFARAAVVLTISTLTYYE